MQVKPAWVRFVGPLANLYVPIIIQGVSTHLVFSKAASPRLQGLTKSFGR